jgi:hypothetical protein
MAELNPPPESLPRFTKKRGKEEDEKRSSTETLLRVSYTSAKQTEISKRPFQAARKYNLVNFISN